jgi:hypothetical protein
MSYEFDPETLDLEDAEVIEDVTKYNNRYIKVKFDSSCNEIPYIIGQFRSGGFNVNQIEFDRNKVRFLKRL